MSLVKLAAKERPTPGETMYLNVDPKLIANLAEREQAHKTRFIIPAAGVLGYGARAGLAALLTRGSQNKNRKALLAGGGLGAALGLAAGYGIKRHLKKKFERKKEKFTKAYGNADSVKLRAKYLGVRDGEAHVELPSGLKVLDAPEHYLRTSLRLRRNKR